MTTLSVEASTRLLGKGFERYDREVFLERVGEHDADALFGRLRDAFAELPPDPYAEHAHRFRRYGRAVYVPWDQSLTWLPTTPDPALGPVTEYYQGEHNPEHRGERRRFPAVTPEARANALLRQIILFDAEEACQLESLRHGLVHVGVHFLKLAVDGADEVAVPSPNALHQDGEPFTFAHLISRYNVTGGVNVIAPPRCAGLRPQEVNEELIEAEFTLDGPLDSYAVYDPKVSHYVSPVRLGPDARRGERSVLLVDFTPYVPHI
ncbi:2OG-Fe dioxygenase family protein [Streptomyces lydicus]|uniref:2OG-Fe dioxygenase family protein n=1 Tax=Streptomyces lydicus TaxID=47763 RepID=UPI0005275E76|nr:2OG-Fe dioxygenase family protein [Streptomyces lydicus]UEG91713.1 2OG-Fe dioxygenase family protein [Streptomyces lydicus]